MGGGPRARGEVWGWGGRNVMGALGFHSCGLGMDVPFGGLREEGEEGLLILENTSCLRGWILAVEMFALISQLQARE